MNSQTNDNGNPFMEAVTKKIEKQDETIAGLDERISNIPDHSEGFAQVKKDLIELKAIVKTISFPVKEMRELSANLVTSVKLLKQPIQDKVLHHHHVPKIIWITIGLAFLSCLLFVLWISATENGKQYKANDTKYRYLKLNKNQNLQQLLAITDSLYLVTPGMRDSVIQREEQNRRKFEMLQEAIQKEQEAKELRQKAKK